MSSVFRFRDNGFFQACLRASESFGAEVSSGVDDLKKRLSLRSAQPSKASTEPPERLSYPIRSRAVQEEMAPCMLLFLLFLAP